MHGVGVPETQYSMDEGKTWRQGYEGPMQGPTVHVRIVLPNGRVLWYGKCVASEAVCYSCKGSGRETTFHFEEMHESRGQ